MNKALVKQLKAKSLWVKIETLKIHRSAPETRLASSLSPIDIFVALYYGKILKFDPKNTQWEKRDRFITSKGHGSIALYPVFADLGFFHSSELEKICKEGSHYGNIPDCSIAGFETINGSLGHGLGVGCGIAQGLKIKKNKSKVFVLVGDGELYEGSNWEAIMLASHAQLDNLVLIVDNNKISMLDYCKNIIDMDPLEEKFKAFGWKSKVADGHNIKQLHQCFSEFISDKSKCPKVLIANTRKGNEIPEMENKPLCHVRSLTKEEADSAISRLKAKL